MFASTSVYGWLKRSVGKYTKDNRDLTLDIQVFDSLSCSLTYKIKMLGLALDHRTYGYDGVQHFVAVLHLLTSKDQFETSGDIPSNDILLYYTTFQQGIKSPLKEILGDLRVPFRNNDPKSKILRVWDRCLVVIRQIFY